jgi:riboflavin kinase/FMN adenylyltransferase
MGLQLIEDWRALPSAMKGAAVALGAIDGVHLGHRAVIATAAEAAKRMGAPLGVITFAPHPRRWFVPETPPFGLTDPGQQARALAHLGVERLYRLPFDAEMAGLSPEAFVKQVLVQGLGVRQVSVGFDFTFGKHRASDAQGLAMLGVAHGFEVIIVAPQTGPDGVKCSSTGVRNALGVGRPELAAAMLGRPFAVRGEVVHGDHLGRTIGFPTANVAMNDYLRPAYGIYAARTRLPDGRRFDAAAYLGRRPTVDGTSERLEVNLFDFDEDLYGQVIETELVAFLRPDHRFDGLEDMTLQIARDVETARSLLGSSAKA